ncbi:MAG TPA: SpoIID/LytB domain-containing protein [Solirubrobacteraceae bacterium]|nr:SpoIID/LytB domain-containing protein [Solirubrobacteraceae bacterium]
MRTGAIADHNRCCLRAPARVAATLSAAALALSAAPASADPEAATPPAATPSASASLLIAGGGYGHGVGMSQQGALGYAEHGFDYKAILAHYYTGTSIGTAAPNTTVRVLIGNKVHKIALETYVRGVVSAEVSPSWPLAALEAQAVASRTYALTAHAGGSKFDVYADTRSQVYRGAAARTPQTDKAVAETAGQIVTYEGKPAITYFFASSGGRTENVEDVFPGSEASPWLRGVVDQYERGDEHTWKTALSFSSAAAKLRGLVRGRFQGIEVLKRGFSPRIVSAYVLGSRGRTAVSGAQLAARFGLFSTWAYFSTREGQSIKPEPDRSGWSALSSPAPAATPAPPSTGEGGGVSSAPSAGAASADASAASTGVTGAGGTSAPS